MVENPPSFYIYDGSGIVHLSLLYCLTMTQNEGKNTPEKMLLKGKVEITKAPEDHLERTMQKWSMDGGMV